MATSLISSCSGQSVTSFKAYLQQLDSQNRKVIQGYELVADGGPGTISAFGLAPHQHRQDKVFSAITFTDPKLIKSANSVFAGLPFGPQPTLPDGAYKPRLSLTNFAASPVHVAVSIATTQENIPSTSASSGNMPDRRALKQLTIAPRRTLELPLSDTLSQSGLLQSLIVETDKNPGDVLGKVVSRSDGTLYEIELLQKDQMDENNGGIHPWTVEGDYQSHLLLFNYSDKPRTFSVGISNGDILWGKLYSLMANETREINFNQLIQDKVADDKGHVLTPDHQRGVVNWMVPDSGEGTGRLMVTSHSQAQARNFSCGQFIVLCGGILHSNGYLPVGSTEPVFWFDPMFCDEFQPNQCYGGSRVNSGALGYNWSVGEPSVIALNPQSGQYAPSPGILGVGPGSGYGNLTAAAGGCQVYGWGPVTACGLKVTTSSVTASSCQGARSQSGVIATLQPSVSQCPWTLNSSSCIVGNDTGNVDVSDCSLNTVTGSSSDPQGIVTYFAGPGGSGSNPGTFDTSFNIYVGTSPVTAQGTVKVYCPQ